MALQEIYQKVASAPAVKQVLTWHASAGRGDALRIDDAAGSLPAFLLRRLLQERSSGAASGAPLLALTADEDAAAFLFSDLEELTGGEAPLARFPATRRIPYDPGQMIDPGPLTARADALQQLDDGFSGLLVTSAEALYEKVPPPGTLTRDTTTVRRGDTFTPDALGEALMGQGFSRVDFVEAPGEWARRGGILDAFPFAGDYPVRIEFFGDEVDSIREFDPHTQRSVSRRISVRLVPDLEGGEAGSAPRASLLDYLPPGSLLATFDEARLLEETGECFTEAKRRYDDIQAAGEASDEQPPAENPLPPPERYLDSDALADGFEAHPRLLFGTFTGKAGGASLGLEARPQPPFGRSIDRVRRRLRENLDRGLRTYLLCDSQGQASRLRDLLEEEVDTGQARLTVESIHEGFEWPAAGVAVYTDHQIFGRYHRPSRRKSAKHQRGLSLRDIKNLSPGDFVVHVDYGIGTFAGMKKIEVRGTQQEAVRLRFRAGDTLYVNTSALYKLSKYKGKEGHQPRLTSLRSGEWERAKARTKQKVKTIARDLIELYAKRRASEGFAFSKDTTWQREMEASFEFEDTPDQATATEEVKADMEADVPMDRLLCGDVGFGKTEVAVRAAFKAAQDGKQVAMLVPTTVLAAQHYETFRRRLAPYPVEVGMLSRFRTRAEQKDVIQRLKSGQVDIAIGTHRLTSEDIGFKDLGLVIIDEEQRFGVKAKEHLRKLRAEVDTLTLTATPIPRTLQFSLLGARDLSIIGTPPPNRQPIVTEIHTFDKDLIRDAILYEKSRGGQVFFIHNRVKSIREVAEMIRTIVPGIRVRVGHGQMRSRELEAVMLGFIDREFDVLVSTTIIENGLDISNANTMILNRADRFGLSEMHQLRGRVGRSERKAFCYLLVPSISTLTRSARQRLRAVEEFSELGSGFSLAMRDLDIRGAGSLLGAQQSGFINEVGYETYQRILSEAVQELRRDEFQETFEDEAVAPPVPDTVVDVEADALIPEDYLSQSTERLNLYRRISEADTAETLADLREEMADRFGPLPPEAEQLIRAAELRLLAQRLRLPKIVFKNQRLFLYLPARDDDPYFYEEMFHSFLEQLAGLDRRYVMKDTKSGTARAIVQRVPTLDEARAVMEELAPALETEETAETVVA